ncbi:MAG TPA: hypothetical protein VJR58_04705 [Vineibacter sp.]|nr:hypothetical protein [Vineibacter sp.]
MTSRYAGQTIDGLLNDPMTQAVMQADHVDPATVRAMLRGIAARLRTTPQDTAAARSTGTRASATFHPRKTC